MKQTAPASRSDEPEACHLVSTRSANEHTDERGACTPFRRIHIAPRMPPHRQMHFELHLPRPVPQMLLLQPRLQPDRKLFRAPVHSTLDLEGPCLQRHSSLRSFAENPHPSVEKERSKLSTADREKSRTRNAARKCGGLQKERIGKSLHPL